MSQKEVEKLLADLRAQHGEIEALRLDPDDPKSAIVVLRKPALAEYLDCAEVFARINSGEVLKDIGEVTRPLLVIVVHGQDAARAELKACPGFMFDLYMAVKRLAGEVDGLELKEAPDAVTTEAKAASARALAFRFDNTVICARPLDGFDFLRFQGRNAAARAQLSRKALAEVAAQQVIEPEDDEGKKPSWFALTTRWPAVAVGLGLELVNRASSKAQRIEGK